MENQNPNGGWTPVRPLTEEDHQVFRQATQNLVGVRYSPHGVSTQVVAGTNYRFVCLAEPVTAHAERYQAEMVIFKPLPGKGEVYITEIIRLPDREDTNVIMDSFCISIPAGPLWSHEDAKKRAPFICAAHGGRFTGKWITTIPGRMSVVECELPFPQAGEVSFKLDVPAGPLWNDQDAKEKCEAICASYGGKWTGKWVTIVPGKMSVCECEFNW